MKAKLALKVGRVKLEEVGFTLSMQNMLQNLFLYYPGAQSITLRLDKAFSGNLRWIMEVKSQITKMVNYVKMTYGTGNYFPKMDGRREAMNRFVSTQGAMTYQVQAVFTPPPSQSMKKKINVGIVEQPSLGSEWIIVEALQFMEGTVTLDTVLRKAVLEEDKLHGGEATHFREHYADLAQRLAKRVHEVHTTSSTQSFIYGDEVNNKRSLKRKYWATLNDVVERISVYAPLKQYHPIMSRKCRKKIREAGERLVQEWKGKPSRLCGVHGDLNSTNVMLYFRTRKVSNTNWPEITLIDFSPRVHVGEPRWDDGRLVFDLFELYLETGSRLVRSFIQSFIDSSMKLTGDPLYLEGLCFGVYSMTLLKLYPAGRPIQDKRLARRYLKNSLRILKQGFFSFE